MDAHADYYFWRAGWRLAPPCIQLLCAPVHKKDKDAGVTFAEHQGYSDRFPIVWTLILNGAAEHAGLQVRAPPHEPRSADVTRAEP